MPITIGQRFYRLTVVEERPHTVKHRKWLCKCECGGEKVVLGVSLQSGATRSCGCLNRERVARITKHGNFRTGVKKSNEFSSWSSMRDRCNCHAATQFHLYGGRGIKICSRWDSFENFLADMGPCPSAKHSIDRFPDNNGNYEPGNCRWATDREQCNNKRNNRVIEFRGKRQTAAQWAEELGINVETLYCRLNKLGWSDSRALSTPVMKQFSRIG